MAEADDLMPGLNRERGPHYGRAVHPTYAPQRMYPRFTALADLVSRVPRGLPLLMRAVGPLVSEPPSVEELASHDNLQGTTLAIVAFPRSGSVYVQFVSERILGEQGVTLRTHDPLLIRTLTRRGVPVLLPMRNPRETILSWSIYNSDPIQESFLVARCHSYLAWARKVLRLSKRIPLYAIPLDTFIATPVEALSHIARFPIQLPDSIASLEREAVHDLMENEESTLNQHHLPSAVREEWKLAYRPLLDSAKISRLLSSASELNSWILRASAYSPVRAAGDTAAS